MSDILLTQNSGRIIGPIAKLLGYIMEGIFLVLDKIGIPNIGLAIILFTIVIYLLLMPLTIKQQKFSKLSARMNPELQAIQAKYKGKSDNESMMAMQMETKAVYAKYGVSPSGSCVQLLIQMPILFALYRVIYNMPAYVGKIKEAFFPLVDNLIAQNGSAEFIQTFSQARMFSNQFTNESFTSGVTTYVQNTFIDVLNKASTAEWLSIPEKYLVLEDDVNHTLGLLNQYNNFLGLNIGNSPSYVMKEALSSGSFLLIIAALSIPVLSAVTQWINVKLMPQPQTQQDSKNQNSQQDAMMQSMKTMNMFMPIMSAVFCYTLPAGMGLYWVAGAVVRSIQQVAINKHIDKIDLDEVIKNNAEKAKKKMEKASVRAEQMAAYANMNTKKVSTAPKSQTKSQMTQEEKEEAIKKSTEYYNQNAKPGSMMAKANMVKQYNEKNNKK
ncbi:MAG: YidC/Oxa1 family membrane protein insertase [Lachnospiraceae bacterium]|nr:YidC/Oxa1 family membrane protein insertase [Lachnospiraceae bacterium]